MLRNPVSFVDLITDTEHQKGEKHYRNCMKTYFSTTVKHDSEFNILIPFS